MRKKIFSAFLLATLLAALISPRVARADLTCKVTYNPITGTFVEVCFDDENGGGTIGGGDPGGGSCTPGTLEIGTQVVGGEPLCEVWMIWYDPCTGEIVYSQLIDIIVGGSCSAPPVDPPGNPCVAFTITAGGVYCQTEWGIDWYLNASVSFPNTFLDIRPFPVTLVRWPSAVRNGGTPSASSSGTLDYIAYGGGDEDDPEAGDWRDVTLTLSLTPASPLLFFTMPQIGTLALPDVGPDGPPVTFQFELPSHPAAGGSLLAGQVSGLAELPPDMPLFAGSATSAYRLFWSLSYEAYDKDCEPGPDPETGTFNCQLSGQSIEDDGHWEYEWENQNMGGEITPDMVIGLPSEIAADLDGDGTPDAYWNHQVTVRRMDDNNQIDNPTWQASWSWGGVVYWAVREGQGQVGWP